MNGYLRIIGISNKVSMKDVNIAARNMLELTDNALADSNGADIIMYGLYSAAPKSYGSLLTNKNIRVQTADCIEKIRQKTLKNNMTAIVSGIAVNKGRADYEVLIIQNGQTIGKVCSDQAYGMFDIDGVCAAVVPCDDTDSMFKNIISAAQQNPEVILVPAYIPDTAGFDKDVKKGLEFVSAQYKVSICFVNTGAGDTSFPYVNKAITAVAENGTVFEYKTSFTDPQVMIYDFDVTEKAEKVSDDSLNIGEFISNKLNKPTEWQLYKNIDRDPFLAGMDTAQTDAYLDELFELAAVSLYRRLYNTGIKKVVLGVSGGLDSTLALLTCARCMDLLGCERNYILGVSMPGFGTTDTTKNNSVILMEKLGITSKTINITDSVRKHFSDIGHQENITDVVYENAQARERTQILFDLANKHGGLVVGTGDMSEAALGFCTYGGDQMSQFNVNICLTKTMIRKITARLAKTYFKECAEVLQDILDTPVSPELLPPDSSGSVVQKTETILGEYELHDFFLYYLLRYGFSFEKIKQYALKAFCGHYSAEYIDEKLKIFIKRYYQNAYKRNCSPDSAVISPVNVSGSCYQSPSDLNPYKLTEFDE